MKEIKKQDAINYVNHICFIMKTQIGMTRDVTANKEKARQCVDEVAEAFAIAVDNTNVFMDNVDEMRKQGLWLPEYINRNSVNTAYYRRALGSLVTMSDLDKWMRNDVFSMAFGDVKKFIMDLSEQRKVVI